MKWIVFLLLSSTILSSTISKAQKKEVCLDSAQANFFLQQYYKAKELQKKVQNGEARESELLSIIKKYESIVSISKRDSTQLAKTSDILRKKFELSIDSASVVNHNLQVTNRKLKIGGGGLIFILLLIACFL